MSDDATALDPKRMKRHVTTGAASGLGAAGIVLAILLPQNSSLSEKVSQEHAARASLDSTVSTLKERIAAMEATSRSTADAAQLRLGTLEAFRASTESVTKLFADRLDKFEAKLDRVLEGRTTR